MATRLRLAGAVVGLALLLMSTALAGAAWAANIQCPNVPDEPQGCRDTAGDDKVYGTPGKDEIVTFNFDKVADDCEILKPYPKRWWMP